MISLGVRRIPCIGHLIHNAVLKSLKEERILQILEKCRTIVSLFHRSYNYKAQLLKNQKELGLQQHQLVNDVSTRWGSKYKMARRIRDQLTALNRIFLGDRKYQDLHIDISETKVLDQILSGLSGFEMLTDLLSGEKEVTVSSAIPLLRHIYKLCSVQDEDEVISIGIKATILSYVASKLKEDEETEKEKEARLKKGQLEPPKILLFLRVAEVIDPRYLSVSTCGQTAAMKEWLSWPDLDEVKKEIIALGVDIWAAGECDVKTLAAPATSLKPEIGKRKSLATLLLPSSDTGEAVMAPELTPAQRLAREIEFYLQLVAPPGTEILPWWSRHTAELPMLSNLARYILSACATSVTSERLFSLAGHIVSKRRNALKPSLVNQLVFLSFNQPSA